MRVKGCIWDHCSKHNYSTNESALLQYCWENVVIYYTVSIDGLQMSIKRSISGGQTHNQETTVQWTIHFKRNSFFYPSALMVRIRCSASMPDRTVPNADPDSLPAGIEAIYAPMPWKPWLIQSWLNYNSICETTTWWLHIPFPTPIHGPMVTGVQVVGNWIPAQSIGFI